MLDRGGQNAGVIVEMENQQSSGKSLKDKISDLFGLSILSNSNKNGNSWLNRLNGNVNKMFGLTILIIYILQFMVLSIFGQNVHNFLFVLEPTNMTRIWTWFTSIFAHSPESLLHIIGNGIILVFFGSMLEKIIGSRDYAILFITAGVLAGLSQAILGLTIGDPTVGLLGASGALLAVLGVLTVYKPDLTVYLYFFLPVPLWIITIGYAGLSVIGILAGGGLGGIAHGAHLVGLIVGLIYGYRTKDEHSMRGSTRLTSQLRR
jgi:membrane associated rhomboid family serine protease